MERSKIKDNLHIHQPLAQLRVKKLKENPTRAELLFKDILDKYGIKYKFNGMVFNEKGCFFVDFKVSTKPKTFIEIDGGYHQNQVGYDKWRENIIRFNSSRGYKKYEFVRFTNEEVFNGTAENVVYNRFPKARVKPPKNVRSISISENKCRKCTSKMVIRTKNNPKKGYEKWDFCEKCKAVYFNY